MKIYDPLENDTFVMQFGFRHPEWTRCSVNNIKLQRKTKKKKSDKQVLCTK